MRLTVLSVAFPFAPVRADTAGGAEQTVLRLDAAMTEAGHRSIVIASHGSAVAGELVEAPLQRGGTTADDREAAWRLWRATIERVLGRERVDLIHMHGLDFDRYLPPEGPPVLVTLHLPPSWYSPGALRPTRPDTHLHCVSECQRRACPSGLPLLPTIENGVPLGPFRPRSTRRPFALALGRICPEKGFHTALDAGDLAGVPVLIGGQVFPYADHEAYFASEIAPRLHPPHRFLGRLDGRRRRRLLAASRCLLVPSVAPETSSLVAMEALAAGISVVAFPAGALPDIVEHGVTGWIVADAGEMAEAISRIDRLDPRACRQAAESRFSLERMAGEYLRLYEQLSRPRACARGGRSPGRDERAPPALVVDEITDADALERLAPEWHDLWRRDAAATPFQSPQWLIPWWRHIGRGDLWTLAVRESRDRGAAGPLLALLPLYIYTHPGSAKRELFPLGISTSDYLDGLFDPARRAECAAAIVGRLETAQERWDACDLRQLRPGSPLLDAPLPAGWTSDVSPDEPCPVLVLPAQVPPKMLQNLRTYRRRAERAGSLRITTVQPECVEETLGDLFRASQGTLALPLRPRGARGRRSRGVPQRREPAARGRRHAPPPRPAPRRACRRRDVRALESGAT